MRALRFAFAFSLLAAFGSAIADPLKVVIDGKETQISQDDIQKLPSHDVSLKEHDGTSSVYSGALIADILGKAGLPLGDQLRGKMLASYVLIKATDGYEVVFGLGEMEPSISGHDIILAYKFNGQPLLPTTGPLRVAVGGDKKQARSIRMVTEIDVVSLRK